MLNVKNQKQDFKPPQSADIQSLKPYFKDKNTTDRLLNDDLPAINVVGSLEVDETWEAGSVYCITSTVTVPDEVTLTIEAGTIIKVCHSGIAIQVSSVDTNGDGNSSSPAVGDYARAIYAQEGSTVNVEHAEVKYTSDAFVLNADALISNVKVRYVSLGFNICDASGHLEGIAIQDATNGLTVQGDSDITYQGTIHDVSNKGMQACSWDQACSVDAAYTD